MKPRATKRLRAVLVGVALGLVALELAMQVVAYLAWRQGDGFRVRAVDSRTRVLCLRLRVGRHHRSRTRASRLAFGPLAQVCRASLASLGRLTHSPPSAGGPAR